MNEIPPIFCLKKEVIKQSRAIVKGIKCIRKSIEKNFVSNAGMNKINRYIVPMIFANKILFIFIHFY